MHFILSIQLLIQIVVIFGILSIITESILIQRKKKKKKENRYKNVYPVRHDFTYRTRSDWCRLVPQGIIINSNLACFRSEIDSFRVSLGKINSYHIYSK